MTTTTPDIAQMAHDFVAAGGTNDAPVIAQVLCMVEEAGECAAAYRRFAGHARRSGTEDEFLSELADVVIAAYVLARCADLDLDGVVQDKFRRLMERPFKDAS